MLRLALILALWPALVAAETWRVDLDQTEIRTEVTYLGRAKLGVEFTRFAAAVAFDDAKVGATQAEIAVATSSARTGLGWIDALIRSEDYLNSAQHPEIRFRLDRLQQTSPSTARLTGAGTLLGVTQPLVLDATVFKFGDAAGGHREAGFNITGTLDRRQFGNQTGFPQVSADLPLNIRLVLTTRAL